MLNERVGLEVLDLVEDVLANVQIDSFCQGCVGIRRIDRGASLGVELREMRLGDLTQSPGRPIPNHHTARVAAHDRMSDVHPSHSELNAADDQVSKPIMLRGDGLTKVLHDVHPARMHKRHIVRRRSMIRASDHQYVGRIQRR